MKTTLATMISFLFFVNGIMAQHSLPENFKIEKYINTFNIDSVFPNGSAGWSYWYFAPNVADTLSIKTSRIFLKDAPHPPHSHPADELFFIVQGPAIFHLNGEERVVQTGDVYYCPSFSTHTIKRAGEGPIQYYIMTREARGATKGFEVGNKNYTINDCIFYADKDLSWINTEEKASVVALDEKFSGGMRLVMHRITSKDKTYNTEKPYTAEQEVFYIISGEADITLNGQKSHIGPNTAFWAPKGTKRSVIQTGQSPLVYLQCTTHLY